MMNADTLFFFEGHSKALDLYEKFKSSVFERIADVKIRVSKTQIAFSNKRGFAQISFLPVRKAKDRPERWITVSFGLGYRLDSTRIDAATEPYPDRWTHHVMVGSTEEIDDELMGWIMEAAAFSAAKR